MKRQSEKLAITNFESHYKTSFFKHPDKHENNCECTPNS
jgi:hypothetical protein